MNKQINTPLTLTLEERNEIAGKMANCPFGGTVVATGQLSVFNSLEIPLATIDEIARLGDLGSGNPGTQLLKLFGWGNHNRLVIPKESVDPFVPNGMFSLHLVRVTGSTRRSQRHSSGRSGGHGQ